MEEAREKDHNRLGREMELFTTVDVIGGGLPLILPKGTNHAAGTPEMDRRSGGQRVGIYPYKDSAVCQRAIYIKFQDTGITIKEGMFVMGDEEKDREVFALRPMTCPFQYYVYKNRQHSYRESCR